MSLAPAPMAAGPRVASPGAAFASNNPFRRAVSPANTSDDSRPRVATNTSDDSRPRVATNNNNPFLDPPANGAPTYQQQPAANTNPFAEDLFQDLTLLDKPAIIEPPKSGPPRAGMPVSGHRPSRSQEDESRRRAPPPKPRAPPETLDIFASPPKPSSRRPRRNSESSVMDSNKSAEDEKRRRERRKEREARREKDGKPKDPKAKTRKPQGLDLIDKLDVTGIYGQGLFHHDGPFDACNPHRNRKKDQRAPMQAFPVGSANNVLGGSGPVNKNIDLDRFHGRGEEGFNDFGSTGVERTKPKVQETFNPADRIEHVHGEETHGLGTSTFLEGAPASKKALQQREAENDQFGPGSSLSRKKSLAHRFRGLSQPRRNGEFPADRVISPDARYGATSPGSPDYEPQSAGGPSRSRFTPQQEKNPFFETYDDAYEKKGTQIRIAEQNHPGRARATSSPRPANLTRSVTADSATSPVDELPERPPGGFLNRMKSLKGGRRPRPDKQREY